MPLAIAKPSVLAIIGARGGSKSLPRKNIAPLLGKPLIGWTIEASRASGSITRTIVTTDDDEIAEVARRFGADVPFMRPPELARDDTPGMAPVIHALEWLERHEGFATDVVVYLQPTSPCRTATDIDMAIALLVSRDADSVVSVTPADQHPFWMKRIDADGWMHDFISADESIVLRQQLPTAYSLNGALYVARRDVVQSTGGWYTDRTVAYVMPKERSVDIDTADDFALAAALLGAPSR